MDQPRPKVRGLSALLATTTQAAPPVPGVPAAAGVDDVATTMEVNRASIRPNPNQPRTQFEPVALDELAASIKANGLIQPVVVRQLPPNEIQNGIVYEIIAGERRWRASEKAGLERIPVVVKKVFSDREILLLSLVENLQRDDLNPIEESLAYQRLQNTFSLTHDQIADGVGKSRAAVTNALRLLELPSTIQDALKNKRLTVGHAKVLMSIPDNRIQSQLAAKAQAESLSVRELEKLCAWESAEQKLPVKVRKSTKPAGKSRLTGAHVQDAERRLREHFGTRVQVEEGLRRGRVVIEFYSVEDFQRILSLMGVDS